MTSSTTSIRGMLKLLLLLGGLGCDGSGSSIYPVVYEEGQCPKPIVVEEITGPQAIAREGVTVYYPKGLSRQAEGFAGLIAKQLSHVRATTGFEFRSKQVTVYLKFLNEVAPERLPNPFFGKSGAFAMVLFVQPDKTSCEDIIALNKAYPYVFMHELVEWSLTSDSPRPRLLHDYRHKTFWGRTVDNFHYTRWFREGFASYAGFLVCKTMVVGDGFRWEEISSEVLRRQLDRNPFSSLARLGKKLFVWHQYRNHPGLEFNVSLPHEQDNTDRYAATLGLFLVIEGRYGQNAIREIVQKVNKLENGTGEDLKKIVSQVLGADIVELAEAFCFPKTGLDMVAVHPPYPLPGFSITEGLWVAGVGVDGLAQRAGIRRRDVVVSLDGERTVTNFDFELALYERMGQQSVTIGIWREGVGKMSVELTLQRATR